MRMIPLRVFGVVFVMSAGACLSAGAHEQVKEDEFPVAAPDYSPNVGRVFPNRVYWGDTHLHTSYSVDGGMVGCTLGPEEAYRYARGEEITGSGLDDQRHLRINVTPPRLHCHVVTERR